MIPFKGFRLYALLGAGVVALALAAWVARLDNRRAFWKGRYETAVALDAEILGKARRALAQPKLKWLDLGDSVEAIAASRKTWRDTAILQSTRIDQLAQETMRLRALSGERLAQARAAIKSRDHALARLSTMALSPGDRNDCARQLREAEDALDAVWEAGL